jgi:hypothetical protein
LWHCCKNEEEASVTLVLQSGGATPILNLCQTCTHMPSLLGVAGTLRVLGNSNAIIAALTEETTIKPLLHLLDVVVGRAKKKKKVVCFSPFCWRGSGQGSAKGQGQGQG